MTQPRQIIGIDPGKMTGVAVYDVDARVFVAQWQGDVETFADWARDYLSQSDPGYSIAMERFVITQGTVRKSRGQENWSIELIGLTRHLARWHGHSFNLQDAGVAKKMCANDRLREAGWYVRGRDHANDATRHAILRMVEELRREPPWIS